MYSKRQRCLMWKYKPLDIFEKFLLNELQVLKLLRDPSPEELGAAVKSSLNMCHWISAKILSSFIVTRCQLHRSYGSSRKDYFSVTLLRQIQISVPCGQRVTLVLQPPSNRSLGLHIAYKRKSSIGLLLISQTPLF